VTKEEAQAIIDLISFENYTFEVLKRNGSMFLRARYMEADIITNIPSEQFTRKWQLSEHMVKSELVQTAFKCALTSMEHRTRENFTYKGVRVFGPHFDVEALVEICQAKRLDYRGKKGK
jgi:hypothetical protein